jgi:hypothetical protein
LISNTLPSLSRLILSACRIANGNAPNRNEKHGLRVEMSGAVSMLPLDTARELRSLNAISERQENTAHTVTGARDLSLVADWLTARVIGVTVTDSPKAPSISAATSCICERQLVVIDAQCLRVC